MRKWFPFVAITSSMLAGCPGPVEMTDAAVTPDAPSADAFRRGDSGPRDTGPAGDTGPAIDTGVAVDTGVAADDTGLAADDTGVLVDAGPMDDAFVAPDAFVDPDAFVAPDAFSAVDAPTFPDAYVVPAGNDVCATASTVGAGTFMGTTVGATGDYGAGANCAGTAGLDTAYAINVPAGQRVTVTVTTGDMAFDPSISLVAGPAATCGGTPRACLAGDDAGNAMTVNQVTWANEGAAGTTIFAIVDNFQAADRGGLFTMTVALAPIPAGDRCGAAPTLAVGTTMGTTAGTVNDYGAGTGCAGTAGNDTVYAVDVPAGQRATVSVASGDGMFNPSINLVAGPGATCGGTPRTCLAGDDSGTATATNTASFTNTAATTTTIYAVVDTASLTATGPFSITLALAAPPAGDTCSNASVLTPGAPVMGTTVGTSNDYGAGTGCAGTAGRDVVYEVTVPAGQRAAVSVVSGDGTFDPSISLVAGPAATCGGTPRSCLAGDDVGAATATNTASFTNGGATPTTIYAVVDTSSATATGPFNVSLTLAAIPAGDICGSATVLTPGAPVMGTTAGASNDYGTGTGCAGTAGSDLVYAVDVPAGQRAAVSVTSGDPMFNPSISLVAGPAATCGGAPRTCLASDDSGAAAATNTAGWTNTTGATVRVYAVVDSASATGSGPFTVSAAITAPLTGDFCSIAERIPTGMSMGTVVGYTNDFGTGTMCTGVAGADRVYVISVPAGQTLSAAVNSADGVFDPSINLQTACGVGARVCVASDDSGGATTLNTATYMNTGAAAQDVFMVVDTFSATATGTFTLNVTLM